jgi:hypothetical protein
LSDVVIPEIPTSWPFDFTFYSTFAADTPQGRFLALESFLVGLFRHYEVHRSIFTVFRELGEEVHFSLIHLPRHAPLVKSVAELGFEVTKIESYGRSLQVDVDWFTRNKLGEAFITVPAAAIDFRPRPDGTLNCGKWYEPRDSMARVLFCHELRKSVKGKALALFSEVGVAELLSKFEWTPLSKMSAKEARAARIEFVQRHLELRHDLGKLASAMRAAGLYAESTTDWQIKKFMPSLLEEASPSVPLKIPELDDSRHGKSKSL